MKNLISFILIGGILSGCSLFHTHKIEIIQGNVITQEQVNELHHGMTENQVKAIMGTPLLVNIFTPNRIDYVYSYQNGYGQRSTQRLTCLFRHDRLDEIIRG